MRVRFKRLIVCATIALLLAACGQGGPGATETPAAIADAELQPVTLQAGEKLRVVATTTIVADIVRQVGGEWVDVQTLLSAGVDPHAFEPTPQDVAAVADAHIVFANGAGLEEFMERLLRNAAETPVVYLSEGVELRELNEEHDDDEDAPEEEHQDEGSDPHTWTSPANAVVFVRNIKSALQALDPAHRQAYEDSAQAYTSELEWIDAWIAEQIATIPTSQRKLVTDHLIFGYYAERYGLEQVGAVIPGFSTGAAPSAKELAALEDTMRTLGVKALFVGVSANPALVERISADMGAVLATLYTGSLGPPGSGAETYLGYLRTNTETIVGALR